MRQETYSQSFEVSLPASLKLSNIRGSVLIRPFEAADEARITVEAVKHLDSGDADQTRIEMSQQPGGGVTVATHFHEGGWLRLLFGAIWPCKVDYIVHVPHRCNVRLDCVSSEATVFGLEGDFNLKAVSGEIHLQDLSGPLKINTVSGDIDGAGLSGPLRLETVSGKARLGHCGFESVNASSISGDLRLETPIGEGPYRFKSISGDLALLVPGDTRCSVVYHKLSGRATIDLPVTRHQNDSAEVSGGGALVEFNTTSGNLRLSAAGGEAPLSPAVRVPVATTRQVLERIAGGEISAEEGLKALKY
jgi:hypothetical protein